MSASRTRFCALTLCSLIVLLAPAYADLAQDCNDGTLAVGIRACSALIKSGKLGTEDHATALMNRAIAYANTGRIAEAIKDLDDAIRLWPRNPLLYYNRGNIYLDRGKLKQAIADFAAAIAEDASFALAFLNRGLAYERAGDVAASVNDLQRAVELDPNLVAARDKLERLRTQR
ncbi:MAG: tetratricopeptide repeat protein [Hyphomicrobium sp.]